MASANSNLKIFQGYSHEIHSLEGKRELLEGRGIHRSRLEQRRVKKQDKKSAGTMIFGDQCANRLIGGSSGFNQEAAGFVNRAIFR